jgi:hypothetical protein
MIRFLKLPIITRMGIPINNAIRAKWLTIIYIRVWCLESIIALLGPLT